MHAVKKFLRDELERWKVWRGSMAADGMCCHYRVEPLLGR